MRSTTRIALVAAASACALCASTARAAGTPGLSKRDCSAGDVYDRLACKQQGIVDAQGWLATTGLRGGPVERVLTKHGFQDRHGKVVTTLGKLHDRGRSAHGRTTKDHFKQAVKKQGKGADPTCALRLREQPLGTPVGDSGALNGVCDPELGEECASADDPTAACDPTKSHGKDVCARDCAGAPAGAADEDAVAADLLGAYDDVETSMVEMNGELLALQAEPEAPAPVMALAAADPPDPCADLSNPPQALEITAKVLKITDVVLQGAAKIADKVCGQTVVAVGVAFGFGGGGGGNGSAICAVIEGASAVASTASAVVEIALDWARDDVQAATFGCLRHSVEQLALVQAAVDRNAAQLAEEMAKIRTELAASEARLAQGTLQSELRLRSEVLEARSDLRAHLVDVILLLNTPQGLRSAFPAK